MITDMTIYNKLKILIAPKEFNEGRKLTYRRISKETGISTTTLTKYINQGGAIDPGTLEKQCKYFDCQPGDLLVFSDDPPSPNRKTARK
jgi:putative transcriptional regulator